jgi:hypothetical protein
MLTPKIKSNELTVAGVPMAASFPHFLAADESVRNSVVGMQPDEEKHSSHVIVEPVNSDT